MSVGFIVMAHSDPRLLGALLRELDPYPTFLHVDRPTLSDEYLERAGFGNIPGVILSENARCLHWGGYSILQAMLETLNLALNRTDSQTTHFAFLSGQCFPLRPVSEFVRYVQGLEKPVLCRATGLDGNKEMGIQRVSRRHWLDGAIGHAKKVGPSKIVGLFRRAFTILTAWNQVDLPEIEHACGSQWTCLPRELAQELVDNYFGGGFEYLRNAYAPDEVAIPSFIFNSSWKFKTQVGALEGTGSRDVSAFPNYHWLRPKLQGTVSRKDLQCALSSNKFFIRKLAAVDHEDFVEMIKNSW